MIWSTSANSTNFLPTNIQASPPDCARRQAADMRAVEQQNAPHDRNPRQKSQRARWCLDNSLDDRTFCLFDFHRDLVERPHNIYANSVALNDFVFQSLGWLQTLNPLPISSTMASMRPQGALAVATTVLSG